MASREAVRSGEIRFVTCTGSNLTVERAVGSRAIAAAATHERSEPKEG